MHCASFNEQAVPCFRLERMKAVIARSILYFALQPRAVDRSLQPCEDLASRFGSQDDPRLRFPQVGRFKLCCLLIIGMNLHGQRFLTIEKLKQQRKLPAEFMPAE